MLDPRSRGHQGQMLLEPDLVLWVRPVVVQEQRLDLDAAVVHGRRLAVVAPEEDSLVVLLPADRDVEQDAGLGLVRPGHEVLKGFVHLKQRIINFLNPKILFFAS